MNHPTDIEAIADAVAARIQAPADPWLNSAQAALHLGCSAHRIRTLVQERRVTFAREGARLVFKREWLDALTNVTEAVA